jgi:hypothetical protein
VATPDVESDVLEKLAALLPAVVTIGTNAWAGPERGVAEGVPMNAVFVEAYSGRSDVNGRQGGGAVRQRWFSVQVTVRSGRLDYAGGDAKARAIFDALDLLGPWTGPTSLVVYQDLRCRDAGPLCLGPADSDAYYFVIALEVWREG